MDSRVLRHEEVVRRILYERPARKALAKLPLDLRARISRAIQLFADDGRGDIRGRDGLRLRSGDYRVILEETGDLIRVLAIGHRSDVYR